MTVARLAFGLGLALFVWLLHRIGLAAIARNLEQVGWGFAAILAFESLPLLLATLGWRATRPQLRSVPLRSLLCMRLAGDAINSVAPAAVVGGEVIRGSLLARRLPPSEVVASVALAALAQFIAQVLFVGVGAVLLPVPALQPRLRLVGLSTLALLGLFLLIVTRVTRLPSRREGRFARLIGRLTSAIPRRLADRWLSSEVRTSLADALAGHGSSLGVSIFFFLGGWLLTVVEVSLILLFLGVPVRPGTAFSIAVLLVAVEGVFFFVPARAGVQEGGLYAIFAVLGLDPVVGFALALVRRLRELVWASAGLAILAVSDRATLRHAASRQSPATGRQLVPAESEKPAHRGGE